MTTHTTSFRIARAAFWLSAPALALALAISSAEARANDSGRNGHGHGHSHGHAYGHTRVVYTAPPCAVGPVAVHRVYAPYPVYVPAPVVRTFPVYRPSPVAPLPYGAVVYDPVRGNVDGYIGVAGPNFSFSIGF